MLASGAAALVIGLQFGLAELTTAGVVMVTACIVTTVAVLLRSFRPPAIAAQRLVGLSSRSTVPFVGEELPVDVVLHTRSRTPTAELVEFALDDLAVKRGSRTVRIAVRPLRAGATSTASYRVLLRQRGVLRFLPAQWRRTDPLGLMSWSFALDAGGTVVVAPSIVAIPSRAISAVAAVRPQGPRRPSRVVDPFELKEIRPFHDGDDLRRVHWPSTARRNALMVREPETVSVATKAPIHLVVDARHAAHENTLERALTIGASIITALHGPLAITVVTDDGVLATSEPDEALMTLGTVRREPQRGSRARAVHAEKARSLTPHPDQLRAHIVVSGPFEAAADRTSDSVIIRSGLAPFDQPLPFSAPADETALSEAIGAALATAGSRGSAEVGAPS